MDNFDDPILLPQSLEFDKPFISFDLQLERLKRRGMIFDEDSEEYARYIFKKYGYYRVINGYDTLFKDPSSVEKKYLEGTRFEDVFNLFILDNELTKILFQQFTDIEAHFKNITAYYVSQHFGVNNYYPDDRDNPSHSHNSEVKSYLDISFYPNQSSSSLNILHCLSLKSPDNPTKIYRKSRNHIPPWILFSNAYLGTMNRYFLILPNHIKDEILDEILKPTLISSAQALGLDIHSIFFDGMELLREFRNCIAHGSRTYLFQSNEHFLPNKLQKLVSPDSNILTSKKEYSQGVGKNDLYAIIIWLFLFTSSKPEADLLLKTFNSFFDEVNNLLTDDPSNYDNSFFKTSKLPINILERLQNLISSYHQ